jgi:carbamoylphosphate synthase large subunit
VQFAPIVARSSAEFDIVVPLEIPDLIHARQFPELLTKNPIPIPSEESVSLCDDKFRFGQALIDGGFGNCIPRMMQGLGLKPPYILKKRISWSGKDCSVILDRDDEWRVRDQISNPAFYCQEFIPGEREFATHILFAKDRIVKSLNVMYEFDSKIAIKGQDHQLYTVIQRCPHLGLFSEVLKSIGFEGLCCVNYKVVRGRPYIFEINPRFGGSLTPYFFSFIRHLNCDSQLFDQNTMILTTRPHSG